MALTKKSDDKKSGTPNGKKTTKPTVENTEILTPEVEVLDADPLVNEINTTLVKQNVTEQVIGMLKSKYSGMKLKSLDDKEGYLAIKEARKEVRSVGILTEKICEKGREDAIRIQRLWLGKQKEVLAKISEVQDPLDAEIKKYEDEENRKETERKQKIEDAYIGRQQELNKMGTKYEGGKFILEGGEHGVVDFTVAEIKEAEETTWIKIILPAYQDVFNKMEAARIAEENKKKQEDEDRRKAQEKLDAETKLMLDERFEVRQHQLEKIGMQFENNIFFFSDKVRITAEEIRIMETADYTEKKSLYTNLINAHNDQKKKEQEQADLIQARVAMLNEITWKDILERTEGDWKLIVDTFNGHVQQDNNKRDQQIKDEAVAAERRAQLGESRKKELADVGGLDTVERLGAMTEDEWNKVLQAQTDSYNKQKEEDNNKATDKEKWKQFVSMLPNPSLEFKSNTYKGKFLSAKQLIDQIKQL
jgi:hypothetical protein